MCSNSVREPSLYGHAEPGEREQGDQGCAQLEQSEHAPLSAGSDSPPGGRSGPRRGPRRARAAGAAAPRRCPASNPRRPARDALGSDRARSALENSPSMEAFPSLGDRPNPVKFFRRRFDGRLSRDGTRSAPVSLASASSFLRRARSIIQTSMIDRLNRPNSGPAISSCDRMSGPGVSTPPTTADRISAYLLNRHSPRAVTRPIQPSTRQDDRQLEGRRRCRAAWTA